MGRKRVKTHTNFQSKKKKCCKTSSVGDDDRISQLPDEILVDILSLLSINEAARTSVLSSRWINLWKHTTSLDLGADETLLRKFLYDHELIKSEKRKYMKWVNSVMKSHESLTLKEFRIRFHLNNSSRKTITRWLQFAFSRKVQRLELNLKNYFSPSGFYCFPEQLLNLKSSCIHNDPRMLFKSLKALVFKSVDVSDGAIEFFLHNCPLLEELIVHESLKMSKLEICGSSLKLKHLEILLCSRLKSIKVVSLPRLTTLSVSTIYKEVSLENVPMLVDVSVRCHDDSTSIKHIFDVVLSRCTSQLQSLRLELGTVYARGELPELPQMPKLKKLVVPYDAFGHESLVRLAALIRVSPHLEEFELQFKWCTLPRKDSEMKDVVRIPHHHLKVFKFIGYYGRANDVELLSYILENCVALEKIIIHPSQKEEETARKNAKQKLAPRVPPHIELVIV